MYDEASTELGFKTLGFSLVEFHVRWWGFWSLLRFFVVVGNVCVGLLTIVFNDECGIFNNV